MRRKEKHEKTYRYKHFIVEEKVFFYFHFEFGVEIFNLS